MPSTPDFLAPRRTTRQILVGGIPIGGGAPIPVQTMTKTRTRDVRATVEQVLACVEAGADIVRCAAPEMEDAEALRDIVKESPVPVVGDIHYDYRLALKALEGGVACLRLNPGNIGRPTGDDIERSGEEKVRLVVREAEARKVPIRIGVNAGSLEPKLLMKYGYPTPEAMVESVMGHLKILEDLGFENIKLSLKATDVARTVTAYRMLAEKTDCPFHVGVTEAGTLQTGSIKCTAGIAILIAEGLCDTLRVSIAGSPVDEVRIGCTLLEAMGLRHQRPTVVACPTCGRLQSESMVAMAEEIERRVAHLKVPLDLAVMGCEVNGPGESKSADLGVSMGKGFGFFFKRGQKLRRVKEEDVVEEFVREAEILAKEIQAKEKKED